jgi:hypothetical protein
VDGKPLILTVLGNFLRADASYAALWRLLEWSRFRSHVYAIRHRGDELFEDRETSISCQWYSDLVKELAYRRLSYTLFEKHFEVYPRIHIVGKDLETDDALWREICLILLEYPMAESPLNTYNRLALYDLTKNQFKLEDDLVGMAKYYSVVLFRVKGVKVAAETVQIIERMVEKSENQELAINYFYYQMKDQWSMGLFS